MVETERAPDRRVSAAVFGNKHRLELLVALAEAGDEGVNLSELSEVRNAPASVYYGPIRSLMSVGLVDRLGRVAGDRRRWYRRRESRFWDYVGPLARDLVEVS